MRPTLGLLSLLFALPVAAQQPAPAPLPPHRTGHAFWIDLVGGKPGEPAAGHVTIRSPRDGGSEFDSLRGELDFSCVEGQDVVALLVLRDARATSDAAVDPLAVRAVAELLVRTSPEVTRALPALFAKQPKKPVLMRFDQGPFDPTPMPRIAGLRNEEPHPAYYSADDIAKERDAVYLIPDLPRFYARFLPSIRLMASDKESDGRNVQFYFTPDAPVLLRKLYEHCKRPIPAVLRNAKVRTWGYGAE